MNGLSVRPIQGLVRRFCLRGAGLVGLLAALLSVFVVTVCDAEPAARTAKARVDANARANSPEIADPFGVAVDATGNLFVADSSNHRILKLNVNGAISVVAGNGEAGFSGDGARAVKARLSNPYGIALDSRGNLYIADRDNNRIRKVTAAGIISTVAGNGIAGFGGDNAAATRASLSFPYAVVVSANDELFISDYFNYRVRRVDSDGKISTYAGTGVFGFSGDNGAATQAQLSSPAGLAISADGTLYVSDALNNRVRRISPQRIISTVAGHGTAGFGGDGAMATRAKLDDPRGVGLDENGNLYVADTGNGRVRRVAPCGTITTVAGSGRIGFGGDGGIASEAALNGPIGLAVDRLGTLFFSDFKNARVRAVNPAGLIRTVAGSGGTMPSSRLLLASSAVVGMGTRQQ
jgi:trimeric autotransporter adhesin